jgi:hypothetical protein
MEAVGAVASVAGILQVTAQIILSCNIYLAKVGSAGDDMRKILTEIGGIKLVVEKLNEHHGDNDSAPEKDLQELEPTLDACFGELEALAKLLHLEPELGAPKESRWSTENPSIMKRLAWPFKEGKAKDILGRLSRHKENLTLYWTLNSW